LKYQPTLTPAHYRQDEKGTAGRLAYPSYAEPAGHPNGSDETLVDVAPSQARSRPQASDHRVVGLLVVRSGVVVRRVIGTGHPAAAQADDEGRRAVRVVLAVPAVI
jgi:hypothetical protein